MSTFRGTLDRFPESLLILHTTMQTPLIAEVDNLLWLAALGMSADMANITVSPK